MNVAITWSDICVQNNECVFLYDSQKLSSTERRLWTYAPPPGTVSQWSGAICCSESQQWWLNSCVKKLGMLFLTESSEFLITIGGFQLHHYSLIDSTSLTTVRLTRISGYARFHSLLMLWASYFLNLLGSSDITALRPQLQAFCQRSLFVCHWSAHYR